VRLPVAGGVLVANQAPGRSAGAALAQRDSCDRTAGVGGVGPCVSSATWVWPGRQVRPRLRPYTASSVSSVALRWRCRWAVGAGSVLVERPVAVLEAAWPNRYEGSLVHAGGAGLFGELGGAL